MMPSVSTRYPGVGDCQLNKGITIIFCITLSFCLNSEELSIYPIEKVSSISTGKEEGMIGWQSPIAGGSSGPRAFVIAKDKKIYIPDRVNHRINVYDINFKYLKTIIEKKKESHFALSMKIDGDNNIISLLIGKGLKKIDQEGNTIFFINWKELPNNKDNRYNYFVINKHIFLYNNNKIQSITPDGKIEETEKALLTLKEIAEQELDFYSPDSPDGRGTNKLKNVFDDLVDDPTSLVIGDRFFSTQFYMAKEYYSKIRQTHKAVNDIHYASPINLDDYSLHLIDYDEWICSSYSAGVDCGGFVGRSKITKHYRI